jgi:hypothetical protein
LRPRTGRTSAVVNAGPAGFRNRRAVQARELARRADCRSSKIAGVEQSDRDARISRGGSGWTRSSRQSEVIVAVTAGLWASDW